ncbi:MAG: leucine-rich repeat protein [Firmicutes bacterium]|nr:leucine-rich repeat protein [Bacillota bacterium]
MKDRKNIFIDCIKKYSKGICAAVIALLMLFAVGNEVSGQGIGFDPKKIDTSFSSNNQGTPDMTGYDLSEEGSDREEVNHDSDRMKDKDENPGFEENVSEQGSEDIVLPNGITEGLNPSDTIDAAVNPGGTDNDADNPYGVTDGNQKPEDKEEKPGTSGDKKPSGDNDQDSDSNKDKVSVIVNGEKKEFASEDEALLWFAENAGKNDSEQFFEGFVKDENGNIVPSYTDKENFDGSSSGDISYGYTGDSGIFVVPSGMTMLDLDFADTNASQKIKTIVISKTITDINIGSLGNSFSSLEKFVVSTDNPNFTSKDGVLYRKTEDGLVLYMLPAAKKEIKEWPENVISVRENSCYASSAEKIEFPDTVKGIGAFAFLESVIGEIVIPENTASIGNAAFGFKNSEEPHKIAVKAAIPPKVESGTFRYMTSKDNPATEIIVPSSQDDSVYMEYLLNWGNIISGLYGRENVQKILKTADGAQDRFEYYEENGTVFWRKIGEDVPFIMEDSLGVYKFNEAGGKVLYRCTTTSAVVNLAGTDIAAVAEGAFDGCAGLVGIRLPENLTVLPDNVFANNKNLRAVISYALFPQTEILGAPETCAVCVRPEAFESYKEAWGGQVRRIIGTSETYSLLSSGVLLDMANARILDVPKDLRSFNVPSYVTMIYDEAFAGNTALMSITIPAKVTSIGERAFADCTALRTVTYQTAVAVPDSCFENCNVLTAFNASGSGHNLKSIGNRAFYGCEKLNTVLYYSYTSSNGQNIYYYYYLENIGEEAFYGCSSMTYAYLHSSVKNVGEGAFAESGIAAMDWYTAASVPDLCFESCVDLKTFNGQGDGHLLRSIGNRAFYGCSSLDTMLYYSYAVDGKNYIYYYLLENVGEEAFYGCSSMTYVYLHSSVANVGGRAFAESGLVQLYWYTQTPVADECFKDCEALSTIGWGGTAATNPSGFGREAFYGCTGFSEFKVPKEAFFVGDEAFGGRNAVPLKLVFTSQEPPKLGVLGQKDGLTIYVPDSQEAGDMVYAAYLNSWIDVLGDKWAEILKTEDGAENRVTPHLPEPPEAVEAEAVMPENTEPDYTAPEEDVNDAEDEEGYENIKSEEAEDSNTNTAPVDDEEE